MKQLYIKLIMALIAMMTGIQVNAATVVTINNIKYTLNGTEASVTGYEGEPVDVVIPETITVDGQVFKVKTIESGAFEGCKSLISITADYIEVIEYSVFGYANPAYNNVKICTSLQEVRFRNIRKIMFSAFSGCSSLKKVDLGSHALSISSSCFESCTSLRYIVLPAGTTYSHEYGSYLHNPFSGCDKLQSIIYLGKNLGQLGSNANTYSVSDLVAWSDSSFVYGGVAPHPSFTNQAPAGFQVSNYAMNGLNKDAGSYTDSVAFTFASSDMSFDCKIPYNYTIAKAPLTARVQDASRSYGDANPQFTVSYSGFVNYENKNVLDNPDVVTTTANASSNVGTYPLTLTGAVDNNYDITVTNGTLTVTKAQLTVKADNKERTYGAENPQLSLIYTGLKNNESSPEWTTRPTISVNATTTTSVGNYDITVSGDVARNYDVSFGKGTLTISKAPLRISANNQSRLYYEQNPELTCSYNGFVNSEDASVLTTKPRLTTTAVLRSKVGNYPINVSGAQARNYSFTYESGTLEVRKRSLNVSIDNYTRSYNEDNPKFSIYYNGFVNGENENVLIAKPTVSTTATKTSDVGTYTLVVSGGMADNYDFVYNNGQLIIEKAYQTLTWNQNLDNVPQYSQIELEAKASSGLPVSYTLNNDTVCNLTYIGSKTYLDCYHYGRVTIAAVQNGDRNYWPTTKSYKVLTVADATDIKGISHGNSTNGSITVSNGKVIISGVDDNVLLRISTLSGATIYSGREREIGLPNGIYIVRIGNRTTKVVVK